MKACVKRLGLGLAIAGLITIPAGADSLSVDFEAFTPGSVNGQFGWSATGPFDEEVEGTGGGNQALRLSNAVTSGSFGDQVFAPELTEAAGQAGSGAVNNRFVASFDFWSVTGAAQAGLSITVSPDNGSGARMSFIDIEDNGTGLDLLFYDYTTVDGFRPTYIASGLSYTDMHNVAFEILFNDGFEDDVVNMYVNGSLVHTGLSWDQYYEDFQPLNSPVAIDTLLFRMSGSAALSTADAGLYIDNVNLSSAVVPEPATMSLLGIGLGGLALRRLRKRS